MLGSQPRLQKRQVSAEINFLPNRTGGYWEDQGYDWFGGV